MFKTNILTAVKLKLYEINLMDIIGVLFIGGILAAIVTGIYLTIRDLTTDTSYSYGDSFTCIESNSLYKKVYDNNTFVIYLVDKSGAISPLVDADGKPLLYTEECIA